MSLGSLTVDLSANITRFERALTKAEKQAQKRTKGIQRTFTRMAGGIGAALVGAGFVKAMDGALDFADAIDKAAARAGIGTTKLQELRFAADQMGISTMQLDDGMRRFTRRLGVALEGGSFAKDFENLGVSIRDASGNARSSEAVFDDVTRKMAEVETQAQRSAFAAQLFGDDAGPQLSLLMKGGVDAMDQFAIRAHSMGVIMEEDMIKRSVEAKDEISLLSQALGVSLNSALLNLVPAMKSVTSELTEFIDNIQDQFFSEGAIEGEIETLVASLIVQKERLSEAVQRDEEGGVGNFIEGLFDAPPEFFEERIQELEERIRDAKERLAAVVGGDDGGDGGDGGDGDINFIAGKTNEELDADLAYIEGVLAQAAAAHQRLIDERIQLQQTVDSQIKSSEQSIASNSISLLQTLGRERKGFAIAALVLQKGLAIAEASVNTAVAVTKALTVDPTGALAARVATLGQIQIGLIAATGIVQAASINSGGGASAPLDTTSDTTTAAPNDIGAGNNDQVGGGGTVGSLTINVSGVITDEIVNDLIVPAIQNATNDYDVLLFNSDSRQALELGNV